MIKLHICVYIVYFSPMEAVFPQYCSLFLQSKERNSLIQNTVLKHMRSAKCQGYFLVKEKEWKLKFNHV